MGEVRVHFEHQLGALAERSLATVTLPLSASIPADYVEDAAVRLNLYQRLAGVEDDPVYGQLGVTLAGGTVAAGGGGETGVPGVFAAGDCVRGADLIVTAIAGGRAAARAVDARLRVEARVDAA